MADERDFDLGDVLSITTGKLVSPRHIGGIYDILNYMTGDNLFTHQLPRAMRECQAPLLAQHPQLAEVVTDGIGGTEESVFAWLDVQKAVYGQTLTVKPLAEGQHERRDSLQELDQMAGNKPVITVHTRA